MKYRISTEMSSIETQVSEDIYQAMLGIGYKFGPIIGSGGFGCAYMCSWNNFHNIEDQLAVKHIDFYRIYKYDPQYRKQTSDQNREWRQRSADEKSFFRKIKLRFGLEREMMIEITPDYNIRLESEILRTEIQAMHRVNHPNVIKMKNILQFFDNSKDPNPRHLFIFMEKGDTDMYTRKGSGIYNEEKTNNYSAQIARGLAHIHSKGIAHLDLKPENILVFNVSGFPGGILLKITDFGLSLFFSGRQSPQTQTLIRGTKQFTDPVIVDLYQKGSQIISYDAFKADIWSFGVIILNFLLGTDKMNIICNNTFGLDLDNAYIRELDNKKRHKKLTKNLIDFCQKIVTMDQNNRLSAIEICNHLWISDTIKRQRLRIPSFL